MAVAVVFRLLVFVLRLDYLRLFFLFDLVGYVLLVLVLVVIVIVIVIVMVMVMSAVTRYPFLLAPNESSESMSSLLTSQPGTCLV